MTGSQQTGIGGNTPPVSKRQKVRRVKVKNITQRTIMGYNRDLIRPGETYLFPKTVAEMLINTNTVELVRKCNKARQ